MRAAVVDSVTYLVANVIVADASTDIAPDGCFLVDVENFACSIGWVFDPIMVDFFDPNPPPPPPLEIEEDLGGD